MTLQMITDFFYKKILFDDSAGAIIPSSFFIVFANWVILRYARNFIEEYLGLNLRPWLRRLATIVLHLNIPLFWIILVSLFRAFRTLAEEIMPTPEGKYFVYIFMNLLYATIAYLPVAFIIYDITMDSIMENMLMRMELRFPMPTELGQEEFLARTPNLELPEVKHPPAYRLKQSCSSYKYQNTIKYEMRKCKSEPITGKINSYIPPVMFLTFGHVIMQRFARLSVDQRYHGNLTKWKRILLVLSLHLQMFCFWLLLVQLFQVIAQVCDSTNTSLEMKCTIRSIIIITYVIVAFFPLGLSLLEYIDQRARMFFQYPAPTELGVEGMLISASHRHIQEVKRPLAYKLKRSTSAFILRESESTSTMHRSKTINELDKITNIEDVLTP
ncbi:hypothetical protein CBL_13540 [Carabus blaptoides fortunei]